MSLLRAAWQGGIHAALIEARSTLDAAQVDSASEAKAWSALRTALESVTVEAARIGQGQVNDEAIGKAVDRLQGLSESNLVRAPGSREDNRDDLLSGAFVWTVLSLLDEALGDAFSTPALLEEWSLRPEVTRTLAEMGVELLLFAGIVYSPEELVAYVAEKPPPPVWKSLARRAGRKLVYLPIGQFSPPMLRRIRTVHVLDGHYVRRHAEDYI